VTEIDLNKYEEPYKRVVENYKVFLAKCRAGKLDASTFDDIEVKIGKDKLHIKQVAQIAPKSNTSVIINPYDSENLEVIEKAIKASDDSLETVKVEKTLSVSLPNSSIQELKVKMVEKVKKSLNDQKDLLKKERHVCQDDLKKHEKIAQKEKLKQIEKEAKELFDKYN
jgi:ribosome recycling factor